MSACTEERFLSDVIDHKMEIIHDDGVNRHLRFRKNDTIFYGFDLITWPGHLCVTGDCGTYVFARILDMFGFFRTDKKPSGEKLYINKQYWAEKVLSKDRHGDIEKFSEPRFKESVKHTFDTYFEGYENQGEDKKAKCWDAIKERVLSCCSNEHEAYAAVNEFEYNGFSFQDFFDYTVEDYTFNYLWCLYAIVWGISHYDRKNENKEEAPLATGKV